MATLPTPKPRPPFIPPGREYVSLTEIQRWTGLHITTLRRHRTKGALRSVRVGGRVLVSIDALMEYLGAES